MSDLIRFDLNLLKEPLTVEDVDVDNRQHPSMGIESGSHIFLLSLVVSIIISMYTARWSKGLIYYIVFYLIYLAIFLVFAQKYKMLRTSDSAQFQYLAAGVIGWVIGTRVIYRKRDGVVRGF